MYKRQTENCGISHATLPGKPRPGTVGLPYDGVQCRLDPASGEIQVKAPCLMLGYFKDPELTRQAFTDDGWLRTGDKGALDEEGNLRITGRVKDLFKTDKGKYVAPAPIENRINAHPMIEMSMVSGVGQPSAYAMVVLAEHLRPRQSDAAFRAEVEAELSALLNQINQEVADYEQLRMIVVAGEPWSIENGMLTPTMKIRRARIEGAVEPQVGRWYGARGTVIWS